MYVLDVLLGRSSEPARITIDDFFTGMRVPTTVANMLAGLDASLYHRIETLEHTVEMYEGPLDRVPPGTPLSQSSSQKYHDFQRWYERKYRSRSSL